MTPDPEWAGVHLRRHDVPQVGRVLWTAEQLVAELSAETCARHEARDASDRRLLRDEAEVPEARDVGVAQRCERVSGDVGPAARGEASTEVIGFDLDIETIVASAKCSAWSELLVMTQTRSARR